MRRISSEEAKKHVPYERTSIFKDPSFYTIEEADSEGWQKVNYFTEQERINIERTGAGDQSVYVLENESMPGMLKIGYTTNEVEFRAKQLRSTGVPTPFNIIYVHKCFNAERMEKLIHKKLESKRVNNEREFFYVYLEEVKQIIKQIGKEYD